MAGFIKRMARAAKLDPSLYEEVEADKRAFSQAIMVVLLSSVAAGIGTLSLEGLAGLITGTIIDLTAWFLWSYLTYFIGVRFLPEPQTEADYGQLLRTIGFSSSPGLIRVLGIFSPLLRIIIYFLAWAWMMVAMIVAVKHALDYRSTLRAIFVCFISLSILIFLFALAYYIILEKIFTPFYL